MCVSVSHHFSIKSLCINIFYFDITAEAVTFKYHILQLVQFVVFSISFHGLFNIVYILNTQ